MSVSSEARDAVDDLAHYRDRFVGSETPLVYFDGNSLGRPLRATGERLKTFVEDEWAGRLIRGWDEGWMDLGSRVGDSIGSTCLGAGAGQTIVGDSTTVLLYKAMRAAVALRPGRSEIVVDRDNFPTDRYLAEGVARECGLTLRWIDVDTAAGVTLEQVEAVVGPQTALVVVSHIAYRSAWIADGPGITAAVHAAGALVLWDLSHSVGSVPVELDGWDADLAVGCSYKYLNAGPGAPAFIYVARRLHRQIAQPIQGWLGNTDPFAMGPDYRPAPGVRRMISGTPPVIAMVAMQDMLELLGAAGMKNVRAKSVLLTQYAVDLVDQRLARYGVTLASPRETDRRGGHVTLNHPAMREVTAELWKHEVIPDYRDPGGLRIGLSPLSTSFGEVERGIDAIGTALAAATIN